MVQRDLDLVILEYEISKKQSQNMDCSKENMKSLIDVADHIFSKTRQSKSDHFRALKG
jgi:hypothetical protein